MSPNAGQIFDVFSATEIKLIQDILEKLPNSPCQGEFKAYTNGFTSADLIYQIINNIVVKKIEKIIQQPLNVICGMHLKEVMPWGIHTDYKHSFDCVEPDLAVLIPLKVINDDASQTHTVIFNESCTTNFNDYMNTNNKLLDHAGHIHEMHCSHCSAESLEYVSLCGAYPWKIGSIIYWNRSMLHCSDNFLKNSISEKQALVLFAGR